MTSLPSVTSLYANVTLTFFATKKNLAGEEVIVFIDSWPLISLKIMFATNQISRIVTHGIPVGFTKGSPNVSKGELLAGEDVEMIVSPPTFAVCLQKGLLSRWRLGCRVRATRCP
jgi:hypothetical protein